MHRYMFYMQVHAARLSELRYLRGGAREEKARSGGESHEENACHSASILTLVCSGSVKSLVGAPQARVAASNNRQE